jgi:hypothetical protein
MKCSGTVVAKVRSCGRQSLYADRLRRIENFRRGALEEQFGQGAAVSDAEARELERAA